MGNTDSTHDKGQLNDTVDNKSSPISENSNVATADCETYEEQTNKTPDEDDTSQLDQISTSPDCGAEMLKRLHSILDTGVGSAPEPFNLLLSSIPAEEDRPGEEESPTIEKGERSKSLHTIVNSLNKSDFY